MSDRPPPRIINVPSLTSGQAILVEVTIPQRGDPLPKTPEEIQAELNKLDERLNDPTEDARINAAVMAEIRPKLSGRRRR